MKNSSVYFSICLLVAICGIAFHQLEYYNSHYGPRLASPGFVERILETEDRFDAFKDCRFELGYVSSDPGLEECTGVIFYTPLAKVGHAVSIAMVPVEKGLYRVYLREEERMLVDASKASTLFGYESKEISRTIMYNARGEDIEPIIDKYFFPNPLTRAYEKAKLIKSIERSRASVFLADHGLWDLIWVMMDRIRGRWS